MKKQPSELYLNVLRQMVLQEQERIRRARGERAVSLVVWSDNLATFTDTELRRWFALPSPR